MIMVGYGICRALYIGNLVPVCMEITTAEQGVLTYTCEMIADGLGGLSAAYIASKTVNRANSQPYRRLDQ